MSDSKLLGKDISQHLTDVDGDNTDANTNDAPQELGLIKLLSVIAFHSIPEPNPAYASLPPFPEDSMLHIQNWIEDLTHSLPILWLNGPPGTGKSAAIQQIAETYRDSGRFAASFAFRADGSRDQGNTLFPTIAYYLANSVPSLRAHIDRIVSDNPSVLQGSLYAQFQSLVVQPFQEVDMGSMPPYIVVIDALDQCVEKDAQQRILELIATAVSTSKIPLRFLITSRLEHHIQAAFDAPPLYQYSERITLQAVIDPALSVDAGSVPYHHINSHSDNSAQTLLRRMISSNPLKKARKKKSRSLSSFPKIVTVQSGNGYVESYSRSLMMTGNGFPLCYPGGDLGKPVEYLQRGICIGDVGTLDRDGSFDFCFNIFLPPDDPIHAQLAPKEFQPIKDPLEESEVRLVPDYFKPGHVIASEGITVQRNPENNMDISFSSTNKEGGILVLPNGASREDMVNTERIHQYAKRNAPYWYQDVNGYGGIVHTNGSLFLVTGCDKTDDWALASFPSYPGPDSSLDLRYTWHPEYASTWADNGSTARTSCFAPSESRPLSAHRSTARHQCVFVRGMRISLGAQSWRDAMPPSDSARLFYTCILKAPSSLELMMNSVLVFLRLRMSERRAMKKVTPSRLQLFHPNFVIGQVLLQQYPESEVALVDDSAWCSLTHKSMCSMSEINNLVTAVFDANDVLVHDGVVSLVSKTDEGDRTYKKPSPTRSKPRWTTFRAVPDLLKRLSIDKNRNWVEGIPVSQHARLF